MRSNPSIERTLATMKLIRRIALVLILAAGLVGCKLDLPSLTSNVRAHYE